MKVERVRKVCISQQRVCWQVTIKKKVGKSEFSEPHRTLPLQSKFRAMPFNLSVIDMKENTKSLSEGGGNHDKDRSLIQSNMGNLFQR